MDDLRGELNELKAFIGDLKADRAAAKEKERREAWTRYVSLTVVVLAVVASVAAQWSGKYSGMASMSQAQASDQWNFYQAQSIKQHLFELSRDQIVKNSNDPAATKNYNEKIADYESRKAKIKEQADALEARRDFASKVGAHLGLAISIFSVSIATASMCLLTKKKPLWIFAILLACVGVFEMIVARLMTMP
ncbi:MAG TPA: DUF4337 domain-containing protein [Verrucomicrobiae bacterium]|jgi:hypothetical protein|nr:DUF4337 domain-containing protein [Verrucomicrobiae bacterium]